MGITAFTCILTENAHKQESKQNLLYEFPNKMDIIQKMRQELCYIP